MVTTKAMNAAMIDAASDPTVTIFVQIFHGGPMQPAMDDSSPR
jgi:hypothetical protein